MIIGVAASGLGHVSRGIESWAADLGRALVVRGLNVRVYKGGGTAEYPYEQVVRCPKREDGIATFLFKFRRLLWRVGLGSTYNIEQFGFALNLLSYLKRDGIDILHVQDPLVASLIQLANHRKMCRTRVILAHGTEETNRFLDRFDYLQHLAPWHLEEARREGVYHPEWRAIPNFIDVDVFQPGPSPTLRAELSIPPDALVVATAAAIKRHHKRIDYLIDEFARFLSFPSSRPVHLVVAGGWETETDQLIAEAKERLGGRVHFLVRFPRVRMTELYRLADIFVLCSLKEMMPVALLEALASGKPCAVNQHPVLEWMIGPGGRAIDMSRSGELASLLQDWVGDDAVRADLSRLAREHCVEQFGRDRVVDQILAYYQSIMDNTAANEAVASARLG